MVLETLLDFTVNMDPAKIAVTVGYLHNFAKNNNPTLKV
jgi:hypothetical protein